VSPARRHSLSVCKLPSEFYEKLVRDERSGWMRIDSARASYIQLAYCGESLIRAPPTLNSGCRSSCRIRR